MTKLAPYPLVPLDEVLLPVERAEVPQAGKMYRQIGVRLWGEGAYEREQIDGIATKYKTLSRVEEGDAIVNKIWARNGSVAVVTNSLAGCYCSSEFPTFEPDSGKLEPYWFHWITKTKWFWSECDQKSRGTSGKNRIRPEKFLEIQIPLPPLSEQRRIVARIEELAAKIEEAKELRRLAVEEAEGLLASCLVEFFDNLSTKWQNEELGLHVRLQAGFAFKSDEYIDEGLPIIRISNLENESVNTNGSPCLPGSRLNEFEAYILRPSDILIALTGATTGKLGIVPRTCKNWLLNQRVGRFLVKDHDENDPKYVYWLARAVQKKVFEAAYGGAQPNISPTDIESMSCPFPPLREQRRIVAYLHGLQSKVDALKQLQAETQKELDALLPSVLDKAFKGDL